MFDYDAVIIGAGPAGLTSGLYLSRGKHRVLVIEKEAFGGPIKNVPFIENYPGFSSPVTGAALASEMVNQAMKYGLKLEIGHVIGIDVYGSCFCVMCSSGKSYTTRLVIVAGGATHKKLNVPGENELMGRGIFHCALCDGSKFEGHVVVVCGGGDSGISESIYLSQIAAKVVVLETMPKLSASAVLQERVRTNPKIVIRTGVNVQRICGDNQIEGIEILNENGKMEMIKTDGVLVKVGLEPNTEYLKELLPLDKEGWIVVNDQMETEVPGILAAGDVRSGSARQIVTAAGDGATASWRAEKLLQEMDD